MLNIRGVSKQFAGVPLFSELSFTVNRGERIGLLGRNGVGKSTLLRIITGQEVMDGGEILTPKGYRLGFLKQHLSFSQSTVLEEACLGEKGEVLEEYKVKRILMGLGFSKEDLMKDPHIFSGGFQLRIHLTKILASEPDCLLLDEPTNYLDILSVRFIEKLLLKWEGEMLIVSHDRSFLDAVCTHMLALHRGNVVKVQGSCETLYEKVLHEEEVFERTRQNIARKKAHLQSFVDRFGAKASKAAQARSKAKAIRKLPSLEKLVDLQDLQFSFSYAPYSSKKVLEARNLFFRYHKEEKAPWIVEKFSLLVENGEKIACIGKNGKGKTTLLHLLAGIFSADSGTVKYGESLEIGYFGQTNIDRLLPANTIEEEVQLAGPHLKYGEVRALCGMMMFSSDAAKKPISVLSGGEKSRVLLAKILASKCNLLLLDEPSNHLDVESVEALVRALEVFPGAVIMISHSEHVLERVAQKLIVFKDENIEVFEGSYKEFLEQGGWEEKEPTLDSPREKSTLSKQERRRLKAEVQREKQQEAAPLRKKIQVMEKRLHDLEKKKENKQSLLLQYVQEDSSSQEVASLTKEVGVLSSEIEELFLSWEQEEQKLVLVNKKFEKKLDLL